MIRRRPCVVNGDDHEIFFLARLQDILKETNTGTKCVYYTVSKTNAI